MITKIFLLFSTLLIGANAVNNETHRSFPDDFLFGTATSSYQVEGGWNASDKGENIWDRLTHTTNLIKDNSTGDIACNSYNLYQRDIEMLKELGVNFYRFSLSWSRILPSGFDNKISADGIAYYNNLIDGLLANGITPFVTLYHWDLPQPLQDLGGWPNPLLEKYFADYARVCFEAFGDRVQNWLTFNEPFEVCQAGYGNNGYGNKAPALNFIGIGDYLCSHTLLKAHARVYHMYDDVYRPTQNGRISLTLSARWFEPEDPDNPVHVEAAETGLQFTVGWYSHPIFTEKGDYPEVMKKNIGRLSEEQGYSTSRLPSFTREEIEYVKGTYDFIGINHYSSSMGRPLKPDDSFATPSFREDMQIVEYFNDEWPSSPASIWVKVVPWGFRKLLLWIKERYNNPEVVILENGYSDLGGTDDPDRVSYYHQYLNAMLDAMEQGCNVSGYTAWSLMDNMEWMDGYTEKFGLFSVDFNHPNRTRTPKGIVKFYSELIRTKIIARDDK